MIVSRLSTITAALLALTLGASSVRAQTGATPDDTTTPSEQAPARPPSQAARRMMMRVDKHIAQLHRRLRITPAEEPQWHAFAAVMRENAVRMADVSATRAATEAKMNADRKSVV